MRPSIAAQSTSIMGAPASTFVTYVSNLGEAVAAELNGVDTDMDQYLAAVFGAGA